VSDIVTLTGEAAHNAVAGLVSMYQAVLADKGREAALMRASAKALEERVASLTAANAKLLKECEELRARAPAEGA